MRIHAGSVIGLVLLSACSTVKSADLRTGGISAHIDVVVEGSATGVGVTLSAGGLTTVDLEGDDQLTATAGGETVTLKEGRFLGVNQYTGAIAVEKPGAQVEVRLDRGAEDVAGTLSFDEEQKVVLPAGTLTQPAPATGQEKPAGRCPVTLTIGRVASGDLDGAFDGGSIQARRIVRVVVQSVS